MWNTLLLNSVNYTLLCPLRGAQWRQGLFSSAPMGVNVVWRPAISISLVVQLLLSFGGPGEGSKPAGHMWFIMPVIGFDFCVCHFFFFFLFQCLIKGLCHGTRLLARKGKRHKQKVEKDWHRAQSEVAWRLAIWEKQAKLISVGICHFTISLSLPRGKGCSRMQALRRFVPAVRFYLAAARWWD